MKTVMMLPQTETEPPKYGAMMRAPSISTVMMQKPLTKAAEATISRGKGEDTRVFKMREPPDEPRANKVSDTGIQWNLQSRPAGLRYRLTRLRSGA